MKELSEVHAKALAILSLLVKEPKTFIETSALYAKMLDILRDEAGYHNSALLLSNGKGHLVETAVLGGRSKVEGRKYPLPYECLKESCVEEDIFLVNDVETIPAAKEGSSIGNGSALVVLLKTIPPPGISNQNHHEYRVTGAILLEDKQANAFNNADCDLLKTIAPFLAAMIELTRHYQKIRGMALYDELTGLYNRRFLHEFLEMEFSRASRNNSTISLAVIDLDSLKRINDVYGHLIGDEVIKKVAQALSMNIRTYDVLARYSGDEFVLTMPNTTQLEAENVINRLVTANDMARLENLSQNIFIPSYSYGLATFPQDGKSFEEIFTSADRRLYQAKAKKGIISSEPNGLFDN